MAQNFVIETPVVFGKPDFWSIAYSANKESFHALMRLTALTKEMFDAVDRMPMCNDVQKAVGFLTRMIADSMNDVITLCGNGSGVSAVKISRSMFEASVMAEYLHRNPVEVVDYSAFAAVRAWRYYQFLLKINPDKAKQMPAKEIEGAYNAVKARFTNAKGRVRQTWSTKKISQMAQEVGRGDEYELAYGIASSMHHANIEGLVRGHFRGNNGKKVWETLPSLAWIREALIAAHVYFLYSLKTFNECCALGFDDKLRAAENDCETSY